LIKLILPCGIKIVTPFSLNRACRFFPPSAGSGETQRKGLPKE